MQTMLPWIWRNGASCEWLRSSSLAGRIGSQRLSSDGFTGCDQISSRVVILNSLTLRCGDENR
jgi:hypothetical protein